MDYSARVADALREVISRGLEEVAGELESAVKQNSRTATGQTKNSWQHQITAEGDTAEAVVGSPLENAIWEEFGTGEYALGGNGRKGGWYYEDAEGNGHWTHGKRPSRALWHAYTERKDPLIAHLQDLFKEGLS